MEKILDVNRERIHGRISYSLETWQSKIIESVDIPKLMKPIFLELIVAIG